MAPSDAAFVIFPFRIISTWSLSTSVLHFAKHRLTYCLKLKWCKNYLTFFAVNGVYIRIGTIIRYDVIITLMNSQRSRTYITFCLIKFGMIMSRLPNKAPEVFHFTFHIDNWKWHQLTIFVSLPLPHCSTCQFALAISKASLNKSVSLRLGHTLSIYIYIYIYSK